MSAAANNSNNNNTSKNGEASFSHAVSRSVELLSCGKTALKIAKAQHAGEDDYGGTMWWACQQPNNLALCSWKVDKNSYHHQPQQKSHLDGLCEDGLSLLRTMDAELNQLESLVRRRGHTNDPTEEIAASVRRLETDAKELSSLVKTGFAMPRASAQYQRHNQLIASWMESVAGKQMAKLKEILKVRGNVLADQAQRRKLLNPQGPGQSNDSTNNSNGNGTAGQNGVHSHNMGAASNRATQPKRIAPRAMDTPLFNMAPLPKPNAYSNQPNGSARAAPPSSAPAVNGGSSNVTRPAQTTATPTYARTNPYGGGPSSAGMGGGYGGGYGGGGYGGAGNGGYYGAGGASSSGEGMRQRRSNRPTSSHDHQNSQQEEDAAAQVQAQIQQRQQQRQTQNRLQEAQQAERTLAELGTMFTKMTSLISQQGEVLEKVEDDVEAGLQEIIGGQSEIQTLYAIKKGNRGLIIKLFSLLIFLIIFMRFYAR